VNTGAANESNYETCQEVGADFARYKVLELWSAFVLLGMYAWNYVPTIYGAVLIKRTLLLVIIHNLCSHLDVQRDIKALKHQVAELSQHSSDLSTFSTATHNDLSATSAGQFPWSTLIMSRF